MDNEREGYYSMILALINYNISFNLNLESWFDKEALSNPFEINFFDFIIRYYIIFDWKPENWNIGFSVENLILLQYASQKFLA